MKYKLFEDFNDIDYLNESVESDIKLFLERMEVPFTETIPEDGSWSNEVVVSGPPNTGDKLFDLIIENITDIIRVRYVLDSSNIKAIIEQRGETKYTQNQGTSYDGMTLALIDGKWYYYDEV
jgi:hypothetical protein